jgi:hypothetical protein
MIFINARRVGEATETPYLLITLYPSDVSAHERWTSHIGHLRENTRAIDGEMILVLTTLCVRPKTGV